MVFQVRHVVNHQEFQGARNVTRHFAWDVEMLGRGGDHQVKHVLVVGGPEGHQFTPISLLVALSRQPFILR